MSTIKDDAFSRALAARIHAERESRGWSLAELATLAGVSKAMLSKIERAEASPTAALLGKLSGAFGLTVAALLARAEQSGSRLVRAAEQARWQDPETGYLRWQLSPAGSGSPLELTKIELPAGAEVSFPAASYTFIHELVWVIQGQLTFIEGDQCYRLDPGDCLELGPPQPCTFRNDSAKQPCRYLVVVMRR